VFEWEFFTLEYPAVLFLLIPFVFCAKLCPARQPSILFPNLQVFSDVKKNRNYLFVFLKWIAVSMSIFALSGPVLENHFDTLNRKGYDIALLLDSSLSMSDIGFDPSNPRKNKFMVVQEAATDFIKRRSNDNMALIVFGEHAFVASPLTFDKRSLASILGHLSIGVAGRSTAINDALALSIKTLKNSEAQSKIAILLTDGINTSGHIPENVAIGLAKKAGIKVYTIGIGSANDFDAFSLSMLAKETGGKFFQARNSNVLKQVYVEIDQLEKSDIKSHRYIQKEQLYVYPLAMACVSLFLLLFLRRQKGLL
jgi:Ca-activated chloride channel homolog